MKLVTPRTSRHAFHILVAAVASVNYVGAKGQLRAGLPRRLEGYPACCVEQMYWADGSSAGTTCPSDSSPFDASTMSSHCTAGYSDAGEVAPPFRDCRQEAIDAWSCGTNWWGETCAVCADNGVPTGMYFSFVGYASCPDWVVNALYDDADNGGNCDAHLDTKIASSDDCSDCRACFDCGALGTCDLPVEERCWGQGAYPACEVLWQQCDWYYGSSSDTTCPTCDGWCSCQDCPGPDPNACDWNCDESRSEPTWGGTKEDCGRDDDDDEDDDSVGKIIGPIVAGVVIVTAAIGPWVYCHMRKKAAAAPPPMVEAQVLEVVSETSSTEVQVLGTVVSETSSAAATAWASEGTVESGPVPSAPPAEEMPAAAPLRNWEMPPPAPPRNFCSACGAPVQGPFCGQCGARA